MSKKNYKTFYKKSKFSTKSYFQGMTQNESIALVYALARKALEDPRKQKTAIKKIAEIIEKNFIKN